ncbi:MAG: hypothetical protein CVV28_11810 [Methanobacteriales archaeon HGW-Methanobacteriales-1]|nr:MAG: hypothetical protein CVV28_11810 [Methanobacteriales archaeon HGW-Methanobacteriales-1]
METLTFDKKNNSTNDLNELIIPEEFVRDLHYSSEKHLMIMIRVMGKDSSMVRDYFKDAEGEIFSIESTPGFGMDEISNEFIIRSLYMDEGPSLSVDINQEPAMVRILMDLEVIND